MKKYIISKRIPLRFAAIALVACGALDPAVAQNNSSSSKNSAAGSDRGSNPSSTEVRVTRATNFLGSDVMSTDGRKVGDIADYYFDTASAPHLKYVVITTGGFLGYGGDSRAVPPESLTTQGDTVKLNLSSDDYWNLPVLPQNQKRFLRDPQNTQRIAQAFNRSNSSSMGNNQGSQSQRTPSGQAQVNQSRQGTLVSFTDLRNSDVSDSEGQDLGRFIDAWVSLNLNRAPYLEISALPRSPFEVLPRTRYAVPMTELRPNAGEDGRYRLEITEAKLRDAEQVSEAKGVEMVESGFVGRSIIRVNVPDVGATASRNTRDSNASE